MEIEQRGERLDVGPQHVFLEIPGQLLGVITRKLLVANSEDSVQLLQRQVLGLGEEEVAVDPAEEVPRRVPAKGTLRGEGLNERRPLSCC